MNNANEYTKGDQTTSNNDFSFASGSENKTCLNNINKTFFDSDHPKKLESLSKYLMIKFLTVNDIILIDIHIAKYYNVCFGAFYKTNLLM